MIHHVCRAAWKPEATQEQKEAALESWRNQGRTIPVVKSFLVGNDLGGEYDHSAIFSVEDLDALFEYLTHPTTYETDNLGMHLLDRLEIFDISDDDDPDLYSKIEALQLRRNEHNPAIAKKLTELPTYLGAGLEK